MSQSDKVKRGKYKPREPKFATKCVHTDQPFYAHGLCSSCYRTHGRTKLATDCQHKERKLYARNVCKPCYLKIYCSGRKHCKTTGTEK